MIDVDPDTIASFDSLIAQRGGAACFTDFQLDVAVAVVEMMKDLRNRDAAPGERTKTARGAADLLELLPSVLPPRSARPTIDMATLSLQEQANFYACMLADPFGFDYDSEPAPSPPAMPIIAGPVQPEPTPPPTYAAEPEAAPLPPVSRVPAPISATPAPPAPEPPPPPQPGDPRMSFRSLGGCILTGPSVDFVPTGRVIPMFQRGETPVLADEFVLKPVINSVEEEVSHGGP